MHYCAYKIGVLPEVPLLVRLHVSWGLYADHAKCQPVVSVLIMLESHWDLYAHQVLGLVGVSLLVSFGIC